MAFDPDPDVGELRPAQRLGEGADLILRGRGQDSRAVAEGQAQVDAARLGRPLTGALLRRAGRGLLGPRRRRLGAELVVRDSEKPRVAETRGPSGSAGSVASSEVAASGHSPVRLHIIVGGRRLALLGESRVGNQHHGRKQQGQTELAHIAS